MDITNFGNVLKQDIQNHLGEDYMIDLQEVVKNNGIVHKAITIRKEGSNIAPTIYIDDLYRNYKEGESFAVITDSVLNLYRKSCIGNDVDLEFFRDFAEVVTHLSFKLAMTGPNMERLKDVPVKRIHDLALIPICILNIKENEQGSIMITREHLKMWEITEKELWENVFIAAPRMFPASVRTITDYLGKDMFDCPGALENIYVVTNSTGYNGAGAVLYPGVLEEISGKVQDDLYVIPSSVHEMIVMSVSECMIPPEYIRNIIHEVNFSVVSDEEVLSHNLYYYSGEEDKLRICDEDCGCSGNQ